MACVNQQRRIAMMLLSDHVFSQSPKTVKRLINYITTEPGFERLTASDTLADFGLPATAGRDALFRHCLRIIPTDEDVVRRRLLRSVAAVNADRKRLIEVWRQRRGDQETTSEHFLEALDYSILDQFSSEEVQSFTEHDYDLRMRWYAFTNRYEDIVDDRILRSLAYEKLFDGTMVFLRSSRPKTKRTEIEALSLLLNVHGLSRLVTSKGMGGTVGDIMQRYFGIGDWRIFDADCEEFGTPSNDRYAEFGRFVLDHMRTEVSVWRKSIDPWEALVDRGLDVSSGGFLFAQIAAVSTVVDVRQRVGTWGDDGFSATLGLVARLRYAIEKTGDASWWSSNLGAANSKDSVLCLAVLLSWGDDKTQNKR